MSSINDESPDHVRDALMRIRVGNFLDDPATSKLIEEMPGEEIRTAIKAAFRAIRAWIGEEDSNGSLLN